MLLTGAMAGIAGMKLADELKEPTKKVFGWLFEKGKNKYDDHKLDQALSNLSDRIVRVTKVKTIYKGDDSIDLQGFYVPTRIEDINTSIDFVTDISRQSIVLQGTVGQGKSIFMRYLTFQEARQGQRIPLFYELRRLDDNDTLINALSKQINNWITEFEESDFDRVAKTGELVLFLDGFDEVPHDKVKKLLNEIEEWCERYPNMQIIVSSRPDADIQRSNYLKVFKLSEYRFYEQSLLIDKLVEESESNKLLKQAIKDSNTEIQDLLKTPLMVTLFVMNYRGSLEIPTNQHEFYKNLFTILISRHDKTKPGFKRESNSGLNEVQLQEVFEEFCFITFSMDILVFDDGKAIEVLKECLENQNIRDNPRMVLYDLSKNVCLILKDGFDYTFIHKSIQEFYYASFIHNQPEMKIEFYKDCSYEFVNGKHNILKFLESMDTYYFYKYLALPVFDVYIKYFNFDESQNKLINYFFYNSNEEYGTHIEFYFEIYYEYPFNYFDILIVKLLPTVLNASSEFGAGMLKTTKVSSEGRKSIQSLFTSEKYNELQITLHLFEQEVLERREEILSFIDKKDSKKYRKYLNR
ncbi:NACHT domain-containing protein [Psychrobacter sp. FBL11]|uniref:NACHT domain-containing protein n=1 Tax=Psychrobacter saeujeotis TaxID=3143436 RepID=A0ABU9X4C9_9GAMM|nr:NACHT domain-containing protein [uncultured Psychrobacter sp.]